tara:strand:- start:515 stop:628 length:114 start_codon:yes stop_codon:yes gene_type:complete
MLYVLAGMAGGMIATYITELRLKKKFEILQKELENKK